MVREPTFRFNIAKFEEYRLRIKGPAEEGPAAPPASDSGIAARRFPHRLKRANNILPKPPSALDVFLRAAQAECGDSEAGTDTAARRRNDYLNKRAKKGERFKRDTIEQLIAGLQLLGEFDPPLIPEEFFLTDVEVDAQEKRDQALDKLRVSSPTEGSGTVVIDKGDAQDRMLGTELAPDDAGSRGGEQGESAALGEATGDENGSANATVDFTWRQNLYRQHRRVLLTIAVLVCLGLPMLLQLAMREDGDVAVPPAKNSESVLPDTIAAKPSTSDPATENVAWIGITHGGQWQAINGGFEVKSSRVEGHETLLFGDVTWDDYVFEVTVTGGGAHGVVVRSPSRDRFIEISYGWTHRDESDEIDPNQLGARLMLHGTYIEPQGRRTRQGEPRPLLDVDHRVTRRVLPARRGEPQKFKVAVEKSKCTCWIDGDLVFETNYLPNDFKVGQVGLYFHARIPSTCRFESIRVVGMDGDLLPEIPTIVEVP